MLDIKLSVKVILCVVIISSIVFSSVLISRGTFADVTASLSLNPPSISGQSLGIGGTFTVTASISDVTDLWGWSLGLSWDPSILQMLSLSEGPFLASAGQTSLTASPTNNNDGVISNINDVLTLQNSVSGSGNLVSFTFQIINYGSSSIDLTNIGLLGPAASSTSSNPQIPSTQTNALFTYDSLQAATMAAAGLSTAYFSAVQSGTTTTSSITLGPSPDPVGTTFQVDVRVDGVTTGFWGWAIPTVSWNPAVVHLTKVKEGPFLADNAPDGDSPAMTGTSSVLFDNSKGDIQGGLAEAIQGADVSTDSSGVVATLTFTVVGYGTSPITISGGYVIASNAVSAPQTSVTCNSATVTTLSSSPTPTPSTSPTPTPTPTPTPSPSPSPTPTPTPSPIQSGVNGPTAKFTPSNATVYVLGDTVLMDASASTAGSDGQACPITSYVWLVEFQNSSVFGSFSGQVIYFQATNLGYFKVTLIVTAPDTNSVPSSSYTNTASTSAWIQVETAQQLANIDVSTDKGGAGHNVNGGSYNPQDLVKVNALVTYNNAPTAAGTLVGFAVFYPNGTVAALNVGATDATGNAPMEFRIPSPTNNPSSVIGTWSIVGSTLVGSAVVTDTVNFTCVSNVVVVSISISGIQLPASVGRSGALNLNVTLQGLKSNSLLSVTVCDSQEVPIACYTANIAPATGGGSITVAVSVPIPSWAYTGTAAVYADLMTALPTAGGVPLCPQATASFQITS